MTTPVELGASVALLAIGFVGVLVGRTVVQSLVGIEVMSKGALLNFLTAGGDDAQAIVVLLILVDAIVVAVMMGLTVAVYRHYGELDVEVLRRLRW